MKRLPAILLLLYLVEFIEQKQLSRSRWLTGLFAVFAVCAVALGYEIFKWRYAVLGSHGDPWDAQEDMLCDALGGIVATGLYFTLRRKVPSC